ncbi:hypothetical protein Tco_0640059 [Tanacetum coccineum]
MNTIHLWEPTSDSTWNVDNKPFIGHTKSVEDLQIFTLSAMPLDRMSTSVKCFSVLKPGGLLFFMDYGNA